MVLGAVHGQAGERHELFEDAPGSGEVVAASRRRTLSAAVAPWQASHTKWPAGHQIMVVCVAPQPSQVRSAAVAA